MVSVNKPMTHKISVSVETYSIIRDFSKQHDLEQGAVIAVFAAWLNATKGTQTIGKLTDYIKSLDA